MGKKAVIGVDIGGTKTLCALVSDSFEILQEAKFKTSAHEGRQKFTENLRETVGALAKRAKRKKLQLIGTGIAFAGDAGSDTAFKYYSHISSTINAFLFSN